MIRDILNQEVGVGDHIVYAKTERTSLRMGVKVVIGESKKGLRVTHIEKHSYRYEEPTTIFNNFVKVPLSVVEEYLKGKLCLQEIQKK